jgi:hypothetical protein
MLRVRPPSGRFDYRLVRRQPAISLVSGDLEPSRRRRLLPTPIGHARRRPPRPAAMQDPRADDQVVIAPARRSVRWPAWLLRRSIPVLAARILSWRSVLDGTARTIREAAGRNRTRYAVIARHGRRAAAAPACTSRIRTRGERPTLRPRRSCTATPATFCCRHRARCAVLRQFGARGRGFRNATRSSRDRPIAPASSTTSRERPYVPSQLGGGGARPARGRGSEPTAT